MLGKTKTFPFQFLRNFRFETGYRMSFCTFGQILPAFDLGQPGLLRAAYRAIVRDGTSTDQETLLNAVLLRRVWSQLVLPGRCRDLWEATFPELVSEAGP